MTVSDLSADCPQCNKPSGLVPRGSAYILDDLHARKSFICSKCGFTVGVEIEHLADESALHGHQAAEQALAAHVVAAYSKFRERRRAAGLDA